MPQTDLHGYVLNKKKINSEMFIYIVKKYLADKTSGGSVNYRDPARKQATPLHLAAIEGKLEYAAILVAFGASMTLTTNYTGKRISKSALTGKQRTAAELARKNGHETLATFLDFSEKNMAERDWVDEEVVRAYYLQSVQEYAEESMQFLLSVAECTEILQQEKDLNRPSKEGAAVLTRLEERFILEGSPHEINLPDKIHHADVSSFWNRIDRMIQARDNIEKMLYRDKNLKVKHILKTHDLKTRVASFQTLLESAKRSTQKAESKKNQLCGVAKKQGSARESILPSTIGFVGDVPLTPGNVARIAEKAHEKAKLTQATLEDFPRLARLLCTHKRMAFIRNHGTLLGMTFPDTLEYRIELLRHEYHQNSQLGKLLIEDAPSSASSLTPVSMSSRTTSPSTATATSSMSSRTVSPQSAPGSLPATPTPAKMTPFVYSSDMQIKTTTTYTPPETRRRSLTTVTRVPSSPSAAVSGSSLVASKDTGSTSTVNEPEGELTKLSRLMKLAAITDPQRQSSASLATRSSEPGVYIPPATPRGTELPTGTGPKPFLTTPMRKVRSDVDLSSAQEEESEDSISQRGRSQTDSLMTRGRSSSPSRRGSPKRMGRRAQ